MPTQDPVALLPTDRKELTNIHEHRNQLSA